MNSVEACRIRRGRLGTQRPRLLMSPREMVLHASTSATMPESRVLSDARYREIFERVLLTGKLWSSHTPAGQIRSVQIYGSSPTHRGVDEASDVEEWEAQQFLRRAGDLQYELGPPSLTDHLQPLDLSTTNTELRRFFARSRYALYPLSSSPYRIPIRATNGYVYSLIYHLAY